MSAIVGRIDLSIISDEEIQAQNCVKHGKIDQALTILEQLKPDSSRIFNIIGDLYIKNKNDYNSAINYYKKALAIQEMNGENTSDILTKLGFTCQSLREYDWALTYHLRALSIRQMGDSIDQKSIASSFFGIANAYWGLKNLSEALNYAQKSLVINQSFESRNDSDIAANLAILANIYYNRGDDIRALNLAKQALYLLESCVSPDSSTLAPLLNNIGTIEVALGLYQDALLSFIRMLHISEKILPADHPKLVTIENLIRQLTKMEQYNILKSCTNLSKFLSKIPLL